MPLDKRQQRWARAIDRISERIGYDENLSDAELADLWQKRTELIEGGLKAFEADPKRYGGRCR